MNEKRYKITLNWYGEIHEFWTHADSISQAKVFTLQKFIMQIGKNPGSIWAYFNGQKDNIKIEEA